MEKELPIKLGQLIKVENKNKKKLENKSYIALQVEDLDGSNERCILFTENEINNAKIINSSNWFIPELKAGRIYPFILNQKFYIIKIFDLKETEKIIKISNALLNKAEKRAINNPEDLTKKSFLRNLFD